jgi:hypothetical protein
VIRRSGLCIAVSCGEGVHAESAAANGIKARTTELCVGLITVSR